MKRTRLYTAAGIALVLHLLVLCWPVAEPEVVLPVILESYPVFLGQRQVQPKVKEKVSGDGPVESVPVPVPPEVKREPLPVPVAPRPLPKPVAAVSSPPEKEIEVQDEHVPTSRASQSTAVSEPSAAGVQDQGAGQDVAEVIRKASPLYALNPPPVYPRLARKRGYEGVVELAVHVDVTGRVRSLRVSRSSGHHLLDKAAIKAVRRWHFKPGTVGGLVQEMWVTVPIRFSLSEGKWQS